MSEEVKKPSEDTQINENQPHIYKMLERLGISVYESKELAERVKKIGELHALVTEVVEDKPEKKVKRLWERNHLVDLKMREASIPYGRAGDIELYREAMLGWETLFALGKLAIKRVKEIVNSKETLAFINKEDIVDNLEDFLIIEVWRYALFITDSSYFNRDVPHGYLITLQQAIQGHGYPPQPQPGSLSFP